LQFVLNVAVVVAAVVDDVAADVGATFVLTLRHFRHCSRRLR